MFTLQFPQALLLELKQTLTKLQSFMNPESRSQHVSNCLVPTSARPWARAAVDVFHNALSHSSRPLILQIVSFEAGSLIMSILKDIPTIMELL